MSVSARGRIAGSLVFREVKGIPVVQKFTKVHDRKSPAQLSHRAFFKGVVAAWNSHTPQEKATLKPKVKGLPLTTYDYYVREYFFTGEDPLGPVPGPSTTPVIYTDLISAHIVEPRATQPNGYQYIFLGKAPPDWTGLVRDNENIYYDGISIDVPYPLAFVVMTINEGVNITAGDRLEVSTDVGDFTIYLPQYANGFLLLYVADDGSTYYDYPLVTLAQAAPGPP